MPDRPGRIGSLTVALCLSLALHGAVMLYGIVAYARSFGGFSIAGWRLVALEESDSDQPEPDAVGGAGGGIANDDSPGDSPLMAPRADVEQPYLSRDPSGDNAPPDVQPASALLTPPQPSPPIDPPALDEEARNSGAGSSRTIPFGLPVSDDLGPFRTGEITADPRVIDAGDDVQPRGEEIASVAESGAPPAPSAAAPAMPASASHAGLPGDPAPQADTESHPFTFDGALDFRAGKTNSRLGRKHRFVFPRIGLDGLVDFATLRGSTLVLGVKIDSTGQVKDVQVLQSSGSSSVDHAFRTVAYQWWFEPGIDERGRPRAEETGRIAMSFH